MWDSYASSLVPQAASAPGTLGKMVQKLQKSTFYVLGRSAPRFASQRAKLESPNLSCKLVFIQAEVSLLSDMDAACKHITAFEQKVDYLYMSPGLIPLNGPQCTGFPHIKLAVADELAWIRKRAWKLASPSLTTPAYDSCATSCHSFVSRHGREF